MQGTAPQDATQECPAKKSVPGALQKSKLGLPYASQLTRFPHCLALTHSAKTTISITMWRECDTHSNVSHSTHCNWSLLTATGVHSLQLESTHCNWSALTATGVYSLQLECTLLTATGVYSLQLESTHCNWNALYSLQLESTHCNWSLLTATGVYSLQLESTHCNWSLLTATGVYSLQLECVSHSIHIDEIHYSDVIKDISVIIWLGKEPRSELGGIWESEFGFLRGSWY